MSEWRHKDEWTRRGKNFLVKISRHADAEMDIIDGEYKATGRIENKWCLYAYFYPKHPHFSKFVIGDDMRQDAANFFDWHCGCSYLQRHCDANGTTFSIQVGCDYNHLYDDRFLQMVTKEDAYEVFADAEALFETMSGLGAEVRS